MQKPATRAHRRSLGALADSLSDLRPVCRARFGGGRVDCRHNGRFGGPAKCRGADRPTAPRRVDAGGRRLPLHAQACCAKCGAFRGPSSWPSTRTGRLSPQRSTAPWTEPPCPPLFPRPVPRNVSKSSTRWHLRGSAYFAAVLPGKESSGVASLLILYPQQNLRRARWEAAWPPLAVGAATTLLMLAISAWLSRRLSRRIESVRALFGRIADGQFAHVDAQRPFDEVYDLVLSANRLSDQLTAMRDRIARTERLRLLAQLAGGLAHQLRNAVTGARMAIQLHQRRCRSPREDESLDVALRQLVLTEEYVRGLLALGQQDSRPPSVSRLSTVVAEIERLVLPAARHAHVGWISRPMAAGLDCDVDNAQSLRAGLLNVVLNAVEAAGSGGRVRLWADRTDSHVCVHVADSGSGPPESVRATMFEPFVTSKPEGVGLGLALAKAVAAEHGGEVSWSRVGGETVFTMSLSAEPSRTDRADLRSRTVVSSRGSARGRNCEVVMSHVLIVDDEPSICWGFRELLAEDGHDVSIASSAEEALDIASQTTPDAVILDVRLPGRDGLSAIKDLRGRVGTRRSSSSRPSATSKRRSAPSRRGPTITSPSLSISSRRPRSSAALRRPAAPARDSQEPAAKARDEAEAALRGTLIGSSLAMQAVFKQIAPGCGKRRARPHHGGKRHGQGVGRAGHSRTRPKKGRSLRANLPGRAQPGSPRERVVRPRARVLYGSGPRSARIARAG